jgi:hypothetical protein
MTKDLTENFCTNDERMARHFVVEMLCRILP